MSQRGTSTTTRLALGAALLLALAAPAAAQYDGYYGLDCTESRKNMQCTEFGTIKMDSQAKIEGQPIVVTAEVVLNTNYVESGARWIMFSIRNVTDEGSEPISVELQSFSSPYGEIPPTTTKREGPNLLNIWVHASDIPVGEPIKLEILVGASERGAFNLETLVMAFDRGYGPILDSSGVDATLFSFTLLSVKEETSKVGGSEGTGIAGKKLPLPAVPLFAAGLLAVAAVGRRLR